MDIIFLISYILSAITLIAYIVVMWIEKDAEMWNKLGFMLIILILSGWIMGYVLTIMFIYLNIDKRFKNNKQNEKIQTDKNISRKS